MGDRTAIAEGTCARGREGNPNRRRAGHSLVSPSQSSVTTGAGCPRVTWVSFWRVHFQLLCVQQAQTLSILSTLSTYMCIILLVVRCVISSIRGHEEVLSHLPFTASATLIIFGMPTRRTSALMSASLSSSPLLKRP